MREFLIQRKSYVDIQEIITKISEKFRLCSSIQGKIPRTVLSIWEESVDMKRHVARKGSIFDFVGDRVHG